MREEINQLTNSLTLYYYPNTDCYSIEDCNGGEIIFIKKEIEPIINGLEELIEEE